MSDASVVLEPAGAESVSEVEALLSANDLPAGDVEAKPECFYVAFDDGDAVGIGGVEVHGSAGLLRSVVVRESERGHGYGTAICDGFEREARADGVEELYLLTTTAAAFFEDRGYERVERERAPDAIRDTTEFSKLCPASATCMVRSL